MASFHGHICGCYYLQQQIRYYLPQVDLKTHTTIQSSAYSTVLTQTYVNPLAEKALDKIRYTFPLYDGVSVVDFECRTGQRVIKGLVKERREAKATFDAAVERGETAGLLEQLPEASDVFTTTVSNIPPGSTVQVTIRYVGELKHDAEVDGLRLTIPTAIAPRYGSSYIPGRLLSEGTSFSSKSSGMHITIDADMGEASPIKKIISPSHPISVSIGTLSNEQDAEPSLARGSATLALESTGLDKDFVLQLVAKDIGAPQAWLETHPDVPESRAIMATFVPKFSLKPEKPEIIFIADRSGSMDGNIPVLVSALRVFIKSLSPGLRFNICSFGSHSQLLWPKSKKYDQDSMNQALRHIETFSANFGGTETLGAVKQAIESRYGDISTELMLLTDGDIWQQEEFFGYLNEQVSKTKGAVRLFTLGIGGGVSHALIEGAARAGNGFSQAVADGERLDGKVVRMLKGALSPHISDYKFDVKFSNDSEDYEIVDKISTPSSVRTGSTSPDTAEKEPISLFNPESKEDQTQEEHKYAGLPGVDPPKLLQAPTKIPSLFPFSRTSVFLLLSPATANKIPESVSFSGTSPQGPVQLTLPLKSAQPGATIHQLAARKAVLELEEGRGWLATATDKSGKLFKEGYPSQYEDIVEREAVRLGTQFQVGSKWCSFVAVEANGTEDAERKRNEALHSSTTSDEDGLSFEIVDRSRKVSARAASARPLPPGGAFSAPMSALPPPPPAPSGVFGAARKKKMSSSLFGSAAMSLFGSSSGSGGGGRPATASMSRSRVALASKPAPAPAFQAQAVFGGAPPPGSAESEQEADESIEYDALGSAPQSDGSASWGLSRKIQNPTGGWPSDSSKLTPQTLLERIIAAQTFDGFWKHNDVPWQDMSITPAKLAILGDEKHRNDLLVTAVVVLYLEERMADERDAWELIVDKARDWVEGLQSVQRREAEKDVWQMAKDVIDV